MFKAWRTVKAFKTSNSALQAQATGQGEKRVTDTIKAVKNP